MSLMCRRNCFSTETRGAGIIAKTFLMYLNGFLVSLAHYLSTPLIMV